MASPSGSPGIMTRLLTLLLGAAAGAAAAHFLDPQSGRRRRHQMRDQAVSKVRSGAGEAVTTASYAAGKAKGAVATATPSGTRVEEADDVTLARKVESEIFRAPDAPKGDVSVDVQSGVVHLRGTADDNWIARLADDAGKVDGVKGVRNLLHRPGTPAPAAEPRGAVTDR
jgi:osmotically-inducible protein OsmY